MKYGKFILLILLVALASTSWAQVNVSSISNIRTNNIKPTDAPPAMPGGENLDAGDTTSVQDTANKAEEMLGGIEYHVEIPDSVLQGSIFIFHRHPLEVKIMDFEHPAFTPTGAQFSDPLDGFNGDYYLGVTELGHPHLSTFRNFDGGPSLAYKANVFPGFYKTPENVNFYQVQMPYTELGYHSSLDKDYQIQVTHTQNINERWNIAFDYHLFSPTGVFANSRAQDHLIDFTTNYYSCDARYQVSAGAIFQKMTLGENYGLSNEGIFINKTNSNMSGIPMKDNSRMSETKDRTIFVRQSYNTVRQFEWYRPIKQQVIDTIISHDTIHVPIHQDTLVDTNAQLMRDSVTTTYAYKLRDTIVGYDTLQPHKPHTYNTGVFCLDLQWDRQRYACTDSMLYHQLSATLYWTNDAFTDYRWHNPLKLYGGIRPQLSWLTLNPMFYNEESVKQQAFYPFAKVELSPWPATVLTVFGEAAPNLSEYNLDATLVFPFRDSIGNSTRNLTLRAVSKATSPELIYYTQCIRTNHTAPSDFHAVGVNKIEAQYSQKELLDIYLAAQRIDHNIWFEETTGDDGASIYTPCQPDKGTFLFQGRLNLYLKMWDWLHYDMQQLLQYSGDQDLIRVPLFASKNSIYADFYLFHKALRTQVGCDLRYHTPFKADGYDPGLGIFYRQDVTTVGGYLWADVFINLQVKRASIYAKAGHINSFLENQAYLILPQYPSKPFGFFFGLTWKFFD